MRLESYSVAVANKKARKQPRWSTQELAHKVGTNSGRLIALFRLFPPPERHAYSRSDGKTSYGLHDFMKWWRALPDCAREYATSTEALHRRPLSKPAKNSTMIHH